MDDLAAVYDVFVQTTADLEHRIGTPEGERLWTDPACVADYWERTRPLFAHLTRTAEQFWVAEHDGRIVGYARATCHDGMRELIDYYVLPSYQGQGIGRAPLARAFPPSGAAGCPSSPLEKP
jgi:GNAT superfamily N-acetyltransferase